MEAHALSQRVSRASTECAYLECWEDLTIRLPALISRQLVIGSNGRAHIRALQMVRTISDALSTTRASGLMPSQQLANPAGVKTG